MIHRDVVERWIILGGADGGGRIILRGVVVQIRRGIEVTKITTRVWSRLVEESIRCRGIRVAVGDGVVRLLRLFVLNLFARGVFRYVNRYVRYKSIEMEVSIIFYSARQLLFLKISQRCFRLRLVIPILSNFDRIS